MVADLVQLERVGRSFRVPGGEIWALREVDLTVAQGDFVALIGRSGSGKTTLLNLIAGLDQPSEGRVVVDGQEVSALSEDQRTLLRRSKVGFIFQSFGLLPLLSAEENVELALRIAGASPRDRSRRAREVLDLVGLGGRRKHRPYELSGGEQQRVAVARAIANRPLLILADEPTGELDSATALQIFELLDRICRDEGATIITTTHDQLVMEHVHHIVELADGRIVARDAESQLFAFGHRRRAEAGVPIEPVIYDKARDQVDRVLAPMTIADGNPAADPDIDQNRWARPSR